MPWCTSTATPPRGTALQGAHICGLTRSCQLLFVVIQLRLASWLSPNKVPDLIPPPPQKKKKAIRLSNTLIINVWEGLLRQPDPLLCLPGGCKTASHYIFLTTVRPSISAFYRSPRPLAWLNFSSSSLENGDDSAPSRGCFRTDLKSICSSAIIYQLIKKKNTGPARWLSN